MKVNELCDIRMNLNLQFTSSWAALAAGCSKKKSCYLCPFKTVTVCFFYEHMIHPNWFDVLSPCCIKSSGHSTITTQSFTLPSTWPSKLMRFMGLESGSSSIAFCSHLSSLKTSSYTSRSIVIGPDQDKMPQNLQGGRRAAQESRAPIEMRKICRNMVCVSVFFFKDNTIYDKYQI